MRTTTLLLAAASATVFAVSISPQQQGPHRSSDPLTLHDGQPGGGVFGESFSISGDSAWLGEADGELVGLGDGYKAFFDAEGLLFIPALGDAVQTNQGLRLTLESVRRGAQTVYSHPGGRLPAVSGQEVVYDHGGISERYEVRPEVVEQSFVFQREPGAEGDLVVRLRVETPLTASTGQGLERLELRAGDVGGVDIGRVLGIDADGRRAGGHMNYSGTHLELVLPHDFVATAAYPLVLDPPIGGNWTVSGPSGASATHRKPDVAYLATRDRYMVVWEIAMSASDTDLFGVLTTPSGARPVPIFPIDVSTATDVREPAVASVRIGSKFVVAYQRGAVGSRDIVARSVDGTTGAVASLQTIAATGADEYEPDIGGEATTVDDELPIVWADASSGIRWAECTINASGSITPVRFNQISNTRTARRPAITQSGGSQGIYAVAWSEGNNRFFGVKFLDRNTTQLGPECFFDTNGRNPLHLKVDGDGSTFALTCTLQEVAGSNASFDTVYMNIQPPASTSGCFTVTSYQLIEAQRGISTTEPAIASINGRAIVALTERVGSGSGAQYKVIGSARNTNGSLRDQWVEVGDPVSIFPLNIHQQIAARQSGGTDFDDALIVWATADTSGRSRVRARFYTDLTVRGSVSQTSPGCGRLTLTHTGGQPIVASSVGFQLSTVTGAGQIWFGLPANLPLCSACVLGADPLVVFPGSSLTGIPIPPDANLIGSSVHIQGGDLFSSGGCPAPLAVRLSNTLRLTIGSW